MGHACTYVCTVVCVCVCVSIQANTAINSSVTTPISAHLVVPNAYHTVGRVGAPHVDLEGSHPDSLVAVVEEAGKNVEQGRLGQDQSLGRSGGEGGRGGRGGEGGEGFHCMYAECEVH